MLSALLPLSRGKMFVNNRNAEKDQLQSRSVDEHLHNMYKTLQKFFDIFFLQFLTFFASQFCFILQIKRKDGLANLKYAFPVNIISFEPHGEVSGHKIFGRLITILGVTKGKENWEI